MHGAYRTGCISALPLRFSKPVFKRSHDGTELAGADYVVYVYIHKLTSIKPPIIVRSTVNVVFSWKKLCKRHLNRCFAILEDLTFSKQVKVQQPNRAWVTSPPRLDSNPTLIRALVTINLLNEGTSEDVDVQQIVIGNEVPQAQTLRL
jgi:hypothetical protein